MLKLTFLGTGASLGVPLLACDCVVCTSEDVRDRRLRTSVLIEKGDTTLLVDSGPDLRQQLFRAHKSSISAILLTHYHQDHLSGLDDLRSLIFHQQKAMPIYANAETLQKITVKYEYADFTGNKLSKEFATLSLKLHCISSDDKVNIGNIQVRAVKVWHGKLSILGFVFDETIVYLTDVKYLEPSVYKSLSDKALLVLNSLCLSPHPSHLNLNEALSMIELFKPQKTYLTHISHRLGLTKDLEQILPKNVNLAYDNLTVNVFN